MSDERHRAMRVQVAVGARAPELDAAAAEALAVVTLLTTGNDHDVDRAGHIVEEILALPGGGQRLANGLSSVCAALLVLLEFHGAFTIDEGLREVGRLIVQASVPT
jgi:hypothetical protein